MRTIAMMPVPLLNPQGFTATTLRFLGPAFTIGMQMSSIELALRMRKEKSVGDMSPSPFVFLYTSTLPFLCYSTLIKERSIQAANIFGLTAGIFSCVTYNQYARASLTSHKLFAAFITVLTFYWTMIRKTTYLGLMGCTLATAMVASPLASIRKVILQRSTASLPLNLCLSGFGNSVTWTLYGLFVTSNPIVS
jgi:uncharacterized protein with PQ loop repeat